MSTNNVNPETSHPAEFDHFVNTIPNRIAFDLDLTIHDIRTYMIVNSFAHTTGEAYASNNWIAKRLGVDRSTVIRSINKLCEKKYIVREEINGRRYLKIVINYMRNDNKKEVAAVPQGGGSRATGGVAAVRPNKYNLNNKKNIINNKKDSNLYISPNNKNYHFDNKRQPTSYKNIQIPTPPPKEIQKSSRDGWRQKQIEYYEKQNKPVPDFIYEEYDDDDFGIIQDLVKKQKYHKTDFNGNFRGYCN